MLLLIDHVTRFHFAQPVRGLVQSHRLTPSKFDGQQVVDWQVTVSGGSPGGGFRDGAGDWVTGWTVKGPVDEVEVRVQGRVSTSDLAGVLRGHREATPALAYLRETPATGVTMALLDLARAAEAQDGPLGKAHALSQAVSELIAYRPGAGAARTTAAEALAQGEGVCQDHAHVLCAIARAVGLPARYVSGYLLAEDDDAPAEAAHAWAELHIEGLGWVGFDAAHECCPDDRYVRLGSGLDAQEAAPIRSSAKVAGEERLDVTVAVAATQQ